VRSSTSALTRARSVSWLLTAKCFTQAPTPALWIPRTSAAPSTPLTSGSSDRYSKLRPQSGERLMLMPGPSNTATSSARASAPSARPMRSTSSASKEDPSATAGGKQVAGTESERPT
jgi:hypothetical protein